MFCCILSTVHPGSGPVPPKARRKPQPLRAHGEVGDEVPDKTNQLNGGGEEGQNGTV